MDGWKELFRRVPTMSSLDTVVQLLKFLAPCSCPTAAVRKGDRVATRESLAQKAGQIAFSAEIPF
jgi:hypothetical protein